MSTNNKHKQIIHKVPSQNKNYNSSNQDKTPANKFGESFVLLKTQGVDGNRPPAGSSQPHPPTDQVGGWGLLGLPIPGVFASPRGPAYTTVSLARRYGRPFKGLKEPPVTLPCTAGSWEGIAAACSLGYARLLLLLLLLLLLQVLSAVWLNIRWRQVVPPRRTLSRGDESSC